MNAYLAYSHPQPPPNRLILVVLGLFMLWTGTLTYGATGIRHIPLNPERVTSVAVAVNEGTTTLLFPSAIDAIRAGKAAAQASPGVDFVLTYKPGQHYLTLRALHEKANDALTVIYQRRAYVFALQASATPDYSVTLTGDVETGQARISVTPGRLSGLLDKAKAYHALMEDAPQAVEGVGYAAFGKIFDCEGFSIRLEEVFRFDDADTLVFHATLTNPGDESITYSPREFVVRVGDRLFSPSMVDATGEISARSEETVFFALTGSPEGGRANLAADNDWRVILPRLPAGALAAPVSAAASATLPTK